MLTKCPECELQVSDKASICPHCGYPLNVEAKKKRKSSPKRMKLPNGFGSITELKDGNRRNRFRKYYRCFETNNYCGMGLLLIHLHDESERYKSQTY